MPCSKSIKKIPKGDSLTTVVWLRKVQDQVAKGIFPPGIHQMLEDAQTAKGHLSCDISRLLTVIEEKTKGLNFISSAIVEVRNAYGDYLWSTYPERRKRADHAISQADLRLMVFRRDGFKCKNCSTSKRLTVDHIVAVANGGGEDPDNLQTLCRSCNSSKGAK